MDQLDDLVDFMTTVSAMTKPSVDTFCSSMAKLAAAGLPKNAANLQKLLCITVI